MNFNLKPLQESDRINPMTEEGRLEARRLISYGIKMGWIRAASSAPLQNISHHLVKEPRRDPEYPPSNRVWYGGKWIDRSEVPQESAEAKPRFNVDEWG